MSQQILIVDDDVSMRLLLAEYFRRLGFGVEDYESAEDAIEPALSGKFDCFIFDVTMPRMTGFDLLKHVRQRGIATPTLFLTALDGIEDKVEGFQAGGDDYLAKPFHPRELEARVDALLRRAGQQQATATEAGDTQGQTKIGDLVLDRRRHEVIAAGKSVDLTPLEFQILELLAREPGRAWSRNELLNEVWKTEYEGYQRNINPHINRLRNKIEPDPENPRYLLTVRGVGYKLNENV
ncbi:MAG: response regulator transcription factor [Pyrinomonadaceae bacterium]